MSTYLLELQIIYGDSVIPDSMSVRSIEVERTGNVVQIIDGKPATFPVKLTNVLTSFQDLHDLTPED